MCPRIARAAPTSVSHHQIVDALTTCPPGRQIVQISFWRSLHDALKRVPYGKHTEPYCLQRVRADHPRLRGLHFDADEHLSCAWLLWGEVPDTPEGLSAVSIPHKDIEIACPAGQWMPLIDTGWYNRPPAGYQRFQIDGDSAVVDVADVGNRSISVLIRQDSKCGAGLLYRTHLHAQLKELTRQTLGLRRHYVAEWFLTYEMMDRVEVVELADDARWWKRLVSIGRARGLSTLQPRLLGGYEKEQLLRRFCVRQLADVWIYSNSTIENLRKLDHDSFASVLGTC